MTIGGHKFDGDHRQHKFRSKVIDGTLWHYKWTHSNRDLYYMVGPLKQSVDLSKFQQKNMLTLIYYLELMGQLHPGAFVQFYKVATPDTYTVIHTESECSKKCGGGIMEIKQECHSAQMKTTVSSNHCLIHSNTQLEKKRCNMHSCPPKWVLGKWGQCSTTCGKGIETRTVKCRQTKSLIGEVRTIQVKNFK